MKISKLKVALMCVLLLTLSLGAVDLAHAAKKQDNATKAYVFDLLIPIMEKFTQEPFEISGNTTIEKAKSLKLTMDLDKNGNLTHEQMACILVKALNAIEIEGEPAMVYAYKNHKIKDRHLIEPWARGYVTLALNNEVMALNASGSFSPKTLLSMEEARAYVLAFEAHLENKKYSALKNQHKSELAYNLNQALYLGADSSKKIAFNLMELIGKSELEVEKRLGIPSHKGFYKWIGYDALAYKERKLVVYFEKNQAVGFSIDNSVRNTTFNGTAGFLKSNYTLESIENEFKGRLHLDGIDIENPKGGYYVYEVFSETGSRYIELIWNHEKEYMGLVYFAKKHGYKPAQ